MARERESTTRREEQLAREAAEKGDKGRPGGGAGRTDVTGIVPPDVHVDPNLTEGHPGYRESGGSELTPPDRLTGGHSGGGGDLSGLRVAAIVTDGFEEAELIEPVSALQKAGARVEVVAPKPGTVQAFKHHDKGRVVPVDRALHDVRPQDYDAVLLPGGALSADALRVLPEAQSFVREFQEAGKPVAVICHGPWLLVSAGLVKGRKLTSYHTIRDDVRNAGGEWEDREVVEDGNWVSSRQPSDIPAFNRAMLRLFARQPARR
jgi:protease I